MVQLQMASAVALHITASAAYSLVRNYAGSNFTNGFNFRTAADYPGSGDPTEGFVNYLSSSDAEAQGLVQVINEQVYLGADSTNKISTSAQGRGSIRLESKDSFTNGLLIADIAHMPGNACGIWPAFWTYNFDEDPYGEIDIIEGISLQANDIVSLHTCGTCSFKLSGTDPRDDCNLGGESSGCSDDAATNDDGCGNTAPGASYGDAFNNAGGGVYATLINSSGVSIWQFNKANVPADITNGNPSPSSWPSPFVSFVSGSSCNVSKYFKKQTIIINIDFCGSNIDQDTWDGDQSCKAAAKNCKTYVAQNPGAFASAYWLFNSIKLYQ